MYYATAHISLKLAMKRITKEGSSAILCQPSLRTPVIRQHSIPLTYTTALHRTVYV
jgi:hypothetical protein